MSEKVENSRSRGFAITAWDMTKIADAEKLKCQYICVAPELAPDTGRPHLQAYVYFENAKTMTAAMKVIKGVFGNDAHIEPAIADAQANRRYVFGPYTDTKTGKTKSANPDAVEYGKIPEQGKRNDLEYVRELVRDGKGMREIMPVATNFQQLKTAEFLFRFCEKKRNWKTRVTWLYGCSGSGKTRYAFDIHSADDIHIQNCAKLKWWQGYDAHPIVVLDECDVNTPYADLKEICDRYPCVVECKGGSRQLLATQVYITSLDHPATVFHKQEADGAEMLRRIDEIICLGDVYKDGDS